MQPSSSQPGEQRCLSVMGLTQNGAVTTVNSTVSFTLNMWNFKRQTQSISPATYGTSKMVKRNQTYQGKNMLDNLTYFFK